MWVVSVRPPTYDTLSGLVKTNPKSASVAKKSVKLVFRSGFAPYVGALDLDMEC